MCGRAVSTGGRSEPGKKRAAPRRWSAARSERWSLERQLGLGVVRGADLLHEATLISHGIDCGMCPFFERKVRRFTQPLAELLHESDPTEIAVVQISSEGEGRFISRGDAINERLEQVRTERLHAADHLVLHDYLRRSWSQGRLRLDLYYGERMYGCSGGWNRHYLDWTEFFLPPSDDGEIPAPVTKDALKGALEGRGIPFKKSDSRNALIEKAKALPGLLSHLTAEFAPEVKTLRPEWSVPVKAWSEHFRATEAASAGILKLMAL